jgi:ABC transporter substrate binding protein (PQQ-dependent alcohol dehydrogenase system)
MTTVSTIGKTLRATSHPSSLTLILCSILMMLSGPMVAAQDIPILYLKQLVDKPPSLSNILPEPEDSGIKGAELAIRDNNSAGRFLGQHYVLELTQSKNLSELIERARQWLASGRHLIALDLEAEALLRLLDDPAIAGQGLLFNVSAPDDALRTTQCRTGLLHTAPSRAMLADALMQFLVVKRWKEWFLIKGARAGDELFAQSLQRASKKFGAKQVAAKTWSFDTDLRRSAMQEIPAFTRGEDYDVIVVADETGDFGEYLPYNSALPRPVTGTQGLTPLAWHRAVEQWGAAQLQSRFEKLAGRWMNSRDYGAWLALRSIAEAVTRSGSEDFRELYAYLLGPNFELAGFKGRALSFRAWNGQLRQPIPLVHPRALVANAPFEGFLHPRSELDTLGFDRPETRCTFSDKL